MQSRNEKAWKTSLFGCFDDLESSCMTCFFPCVTFGQNAEIIDRGRTSCVTAGLTLLLLWNLWVPCLYSFTYRGKLRGLFSLPAEPCNDCCVHFWCASCAICQEYRELKMRGLDPSLGWEANERQEIVVEIGAPNVVPGMDPTGNGGEMNTAETEAPDVEPGMDRDL